MEAMEEVLPPLQHHLQEEQLGQQELGVLQRQREDATRDGFLTGIVMTSATIWNAAMTVGTAVDLM